MLPLGGIDIQAEPVYWTLPSGKTECWSLQEFNDASSDMLAMLLTDEYYKAIGREMNFDVLGVALELEISEFRNDPGTMVEKRWRQLHWDMPTAEVAPCWWLTNPTDDASAPPKLLCRSLVCLRLELNQARCASSAKLRLAYERRRD